MLDLEGVCGSVHALLGVSSGLVWQEETVPCSYTSRHLSDDWNMEALCVIATPTCAIDSVGNLCPAGRGRVAVAWVQLANSIVVGDLGQVVHNETPQLFCDGPLSLRTHTEREKQTNIVILLL